MSGQSCPEHWVKTDIGQVFSIIGGGTPDTKVSEFWSGNIPWITSADLDKSGQIAPKRYISLDGLKASATNLVPEHSVIVATRVGLGKVGLTDTPLCFSQDCQALVFNHDTISAKFVLHQMLQTTRDFLRISRGTTISGITKKQVGESAFLLPPLNEQKRIVEKIEELLSDLDACVAGLQRIQANLKRYRASVLQAAVEGRLTAQWRKQNPPAETGEALLARILEERRAKWEANQLKKFAEQGKTPTKNWREKYPEPVAPDTTGLPELPEGWVWATIDQMVFETANGFGKREQKEGISTVVLRLADVSSGEVVFCNTRKINATTADIKRYELLPGDILTIRVNGSPELVGRLIYVKGSDQHVLYCDHFIRLRLGDILVSKWVRLNGDSRRFRKHIERNKVSSAGQNTISQGSLLPFQISLPSHDEIEAIEAEVSCRLTIADAAEKTIDSALKRAARLRQSILKRAFEGRLVPQDADDEPASVLLERIRAERSLPVVGRTATPTRKPRRSKAHGP